MEVPEGTRLGVYDKAGKLLKVVDVARDGKLAEPVDIDDDQYFCLTTPSTRNLSLRRAAAGTWTNVLAS
jgi:hypothetical protein